MVVVVDSGTRKPLGGWEDLSFAKGIHPIRFEAPKHSPSREAALGIPVNLSSRGGVHKARIKEGNVLLCSQIPIVGWQLPHHNFS